ncbi:MAG: hypothetical protein L0K86_13155 [Actinomycetia bacterium]|nr:hypothetical protein [Actinomycetes bacterium]
MAAGRRRVGVEDVDGIGHATGDVLTALRGWPNAGRDLGEAADLFDQAARAPGGGVGRPGTASVGPAGALLYTNHIVSRGRHPKKSIAENTARNIRRFDLRHRHEEER